MELIALDGNYNLEKNAFNHPRSTNSPIISSDYNLLLILSIYISIIQCRNTKYTSYAMQLLCDYCVSNLTSLFLPFSRARRKQLFQKHKFHVMKIFGELN